MAILNFFFRNMISTYKRKHIHEDPDREVNKLRKPREATLMKTMALAGSQQQGEVGETVLELAGFKPTNTSPSEQPQITQRAEDEV
jgi:hypothetical protein